MQAVTVEKAPDARKSLNSFEFKGKYKSQNINLDDLQFIQYSGGEYHVEAIGLARTVNLFARITDSASFLRLLTFLSLINYNPNVLELNLYVPYFPGARQDRTNDGTFPLTVEMYAVALRNVVGNFSREVSDPNSISVARLVNLRTFDLHSEVGLKILQRHFGHSCPINIGVHHLDRRQLPDEILGIIAPDKGAIDRATLFRDAHYPDAMLLKAGKARNPQTGQITHYELPKLLATGRYLVVDDICDGGATFNILAESFKNDRYGQNSELMLYVSHGIFSKGIAAISDAYDHIYTTPSFNPNFVSDPDNGFTVLDLPFESGWKRLVDGVARIVFDKPTNTL